ncbi:hypothetical protein [Kitasatospora sp. NPDC059827]|uniref:hypothetical protein n=1 Tax=Kitasatospora sp. NPDC059827 TaxID=3346964 RepID=UPI003669A4A6
MTTGTATVAGVEAGRDEEETARRLIGGWLAEDAGRESTAAAAGDGPGPTGWGVPKAPARDVLAVARGLAVRGLPALGPGGPARSVPGADELLLARVLVVDEHPSAADWTEHERAELGGWVAVLIRRFGEAGVQRLTAALAARS